MGNPARIHIQGCPQRTSSSRPPCALPFRVLLPRAMGPTVTGVRAGGEGRRHDVYSHLAVVNLVRKVAHENRGAALGLLAQRLLAPLALPRSALRPAHLRRASHTRLCAHAQGKAWPHAKPAPLPPPTRQGPTSSRVRHGGATAPGRIPTPHHVRQTVVVRLTQPTTALEARL